MDVAAFLAPIPAALLAVPAIVWWLDRAVRGAYTTHADVAAAIVVAEDRRRNEDERAATVRERRLTSAIVASESRIHRDLDRIRAEIADLNASRAAHLVLLDVIAGRLDRRDRDEDGAEDSH